MGKYIFTITAGHTGTTWLSEFIKSNTNIYSIHELLDIDDFGNQMPDIRTMRTFNERGMTQFVEDFWHRKFSVITTYSDYAESNHTLSRCGLLEYLASLKIEHDIYLICIRRNWAKQCMSFINRADFMNVTINWQWYLDYRYARRIVDPEPFVSAHGYVGQILWYMAEVEARQEYYKILYGDLFHFIDIMMEEMVTAEGSSRLMEQLGISADQVILPPKLNYNRAKENVGLLKQLLEIISTIQVAPTRQAEEYIAGGKSLSDKNI